jgi:diaminohydroxyphosphoribosylaminopyrimidine deaminase/5-amino-6-(5-phosphoribosylamino)uracil reductase
VRLSPESQFAATTSKAPVILFGNERANHADVLRERGVEIVNSTRGDLPGLLRELGSRSVQSVLVEGGSTVAGEFIDARLVNKITFLIAPKIIGGVTAPTAIGGTGVAAMSEALELERITVIKRGNDVEVTGYPRSAKGIPSDEG